MKPVVKVIIAAVLACAVPTESYARIGGVKAENISVDPSEGYVNVSVDFKLDSLRLKPNQQLYLTPVIRTADSTKVMALPSVLVNGRNMQVAYERGSLRGFESLESHDVTKVVQRRNGEPQTEPYLNRVPLRDWMMQPDSYVTFVYDSCACGIKGTPTFGPKTPIFQNPVPQMIVAFVTPEVTPQPVGHHGGRARIQFEVDRTVLHDSVYVCKSGQVIRNYDELKIIDDTVNYALSDPHVMIDQIAVCGYASPESPYIHNDELATGRSRALAEYLAKKYNLPQERSVYSAVPENWGEFREEVLSSNEITEQQRKDLLELIDRPAYGPSDYDAKEKELKTSPKFAKLYRELILPKWFPRYRATTFVISTTLKPLSDEELAEVLKTNPEMMTLNQMFRVARLYPVGSPEFNNAIQVAISQHTDSEVANLNVAAALISNGKYDEAVPYLDKAGSSPEADNLRGIIATSKGDYSTAKEYFEKSQILPEAVRNLKLLPKLGN